MKHQHKFVATPITGQGAWDGKEAMFGWRVECEHCYRKPKDGDRIVEIKRSWWGEIVPETKSVDIIWRTPKEVKQDVH